MSTQSTFYFKGNNKQLTDALAQVKKSMSQVAKQTVVLQAGLKLLGAAVNSVAKLLTNVLGAALKGIVNLVKSALNTIKKLVVGAFKFIKNALSTLLSWIVKALGKVFDGLKKAMQSAFNGIKTIVSGAVKLAKKVISEIIDDVQAFADKEYNQIQLKVSLGDAYGAVMKDFSKLLKYTTADKNDLLSVYSTFAELGKSPEDVLKYAKATVYLSNATGKSLSQITRLLLGQEAASKDLETTLARIGVTLSGNEESISNVEKIINTLDDEMKALSTGSLKQVFANIKNDIIGIRENIGQIFSGPVRYVAEKLEEVLDGIANSGKVEELANKVDKLFSEKIQPVVDDIIKYFSKILNDPAGFFEALWKDIKANWNWVIDNFKGIIITFGELIGHVFKDIGTLISNIPWDKVWESFGGLGDALSNFVISIGHGVGIFSDEDVAIAEGSLTKAFTSAWNRAHPDFTLEEGDKWYQTLGKIFSGIWTDNLKPIWDSDIYPTLEDAWNNFKNWWITDMAPVLETTFGWLGEVLADTFINLIVESEWVRKILSAVGMPVAVKSDQDYAVKAVQGIQKLADEGWVHAISAMETLSKMKPEDFTPEFLQSKADVKHYNGTWGKYLLEMGGLLGDEYNYLNRLVRADHITESKVVPTMADLFDRLAGLGKGAEDATKAVDDTAKALDEAASAAGTLTDATEIPIEAKKVLINVDGGDIAVGSGFGGGGGHGISAFATGGLVTKPTLALIGEAGPELVIPAKSLPKLVNADAERYNIGKNVEVEVTPADDNKTFYGVDVSYYEHPWENAKKDAGVDYGDAPGADNLKNFFENEAEEVVEDGVKNALEEEMPAWKKWLDNSKIGNWLKNIYKLSSKLYIWGQRAFDGVVDYFKSFSESWHQAFDNLIDIVEFIPKLGFSMLGSLAGGNGVHAFGSHIGNIYEGSFDEDGNFSILQMFGAIIKELLPYLQKGLDIIAPLFDQAFEILGQAVQILGERLGKMLLPILESFIPLMKVLADIVIALAPVVESVLAPAIKIIAAILQILTGVLDKLMPVFAFLGATIQWISERIEYAIAGVINWLASWIPWVNSVEQKKPKSWQENYDSIMGTYNDQKANTITGNTTLSGSTATATASYNGATTVYMTNDFSGAYVVGSNGFKELALIIKNTLEDIAYSGQSV